MDFLLDTHTLLWSLNADKNLSQKVKNILSDATIKKVVSAVSFWEIAIKVSTGRLKIDFALLELPSLVIENGSRVLPINASHTLALPVFLSITRIRLTGFWLRRHKWKISPSSQKTPTFFFTM